LAKTERHEDRKELRMALYGIYGSHATEACPWNNVEVAKAVLAVAEGDLAAVAREHKISKILGQYHSALEHTFLWVVDAEDPHLIQDFCVATGIASFNRLRIVPLITFQEGVIPGLKRIHSL
jgi:hypothetical protein